MTAVLSSSGINIEKTPPTRWTTVGDWAVDKPKDFVNGLALGCFYAGKISRLFYSKEIAATWGASEGVFKTVKKVFGVPAAIKGAIGLYHKCQQGGIKVRNAAAEVATIVGDTIDGFLGCSSLGKVPVNKALTRVLGCIKDILSIFSLSNTLYNLSVDIRKLRRVDVHKVDYKELSNNSKAAQYKEEWVRSQIKSKQYDVVKTVAAVSLSTLGTGLALGGAVLLSASLTPWILAVVGTVALGSKIIVYHHQASADFWQSRYAEVLSAAKSQ